jgi:RNA polymerase sigma factor (TIGR02999 family)
MATPRDRRPDPPGDGEDVTRLLAALGEGDSDARERLARAVYREIHILAKHALRSEPDGHTLQPTELVHEAFMRLVGQRNVEWRNRSHFYGIASQAIRRILVDHARRRRAAKRDQGIRVTLSESVASTNADPIDLLVLEQGLEKLAALDPRQASVVELRFFGGLEIEEIAEALGTSPATVKRDWTFARAFLQRELDRKPG